MMGQIKAYIAARYTKDLTADSSFRRYKWAVEGMRLAEMCEQDSRIGHSKQFWPSQNSVADFFFRFARVFSTAFRSFAEEEKSK